MEEENKMLERQLINSKGKLGEVLNELAEVESKCVYLEEEQRLMKKMELMEVNMMINYIGCFDFLI